LIEAILPWLDEVIPLIITGGFGAVFLYAGIQALVNWYNEGPLENPREAFHFDEEAPSYEEPPEPEADEPEAEQDQEVTDGTQATPRSERHDAMDADDAATETPEDPSKDETRP